MDDVGLEPGPHAHFSQDLKGFDVIMQPLGGFLKLLSCLLSASFKRKMEGGCV